MQVAEVDDCQLGEMLAHSPASVSWPQNAGAHFAATLKPASQRATLLHLARPLGLGRNFLNLGVRVVALGAVAKEPGLQRSVIMMLAAMRDGILSMLSRAHFYAIVTSSLEQIRWPSSHSPETMRVCTRLQYTDRAKARHPGHDLFCVAIRANVLAISFVSIIRPSSPPNPGLESRKSA